MKKQHESLGVLVIIVSFMVLALFLPRSMNAGELEPIAPPGPTMKTLDEIPPTWSQILDSSDRFEVVFNYAAVLDKETGLVWSRNARHYPSAVKWEIAISNARRIAINDRNGWRLPTIEELASLLDLQEVPPLPLPCPFYNVGMDRYYWTSTVSESDSGRAWAVNMSNGAIVHLSKFESCYIWQVRSGN